MGRPRDFLIAFDPGPTLCGWAIVALDHGQATFIQGGNVAAARSAIVDLHAALVARHESEIAVVAIETPAGYVHEVCRGPHLIATARVAGGIAWLAEGLGARVIELPASSWRKTLCGRATANDNHVRVAVERTVHAMPVRSNVHVRDALGLAVVAGWIAASRRAA